MTSWIQPDDTWPLWAVMIAGTGLAIGLEQRYRWAARISAPVLALLMAMTLSNCRLMPMASPAYEFVGDYLVPLAIPLLLFRANALQMARVTGRMFLTLHIAVLGTVLGALLAALVLGGSMNDVAHAAGIMTGSYSGGGVNFFAVKESYDVDELVTGPLLVADNLVMAAMFVLLLGIAGSRWFQRHYPHPHSQDPDATAAGNLAAAHWQRKGISLLDIAKSLGIAFAIVAAAEVSRRFLETAFVLTPETGWVTAMLHTLFTNKFVLITGLSLTVATMFHRALSRIQGPEEMGSYLLYLFLFVIGLPADFVAVLLKVPVFFLFCGLIALVNLTVTLVVGRFLRLDLEELVLCVNATLGGPPTAAAMAIAKGWDRLVLPALLVGIWGYVIGTPLGILIVELVRRFQ